MQAVCLIAEDIFALKTGFQPRRGLTVDDLINSVLKEPDFLRTVLGEIPVDNREHFMHGVDEDRVEVICRLILRKFFTSRTKHACKVFLEKQKGLLTRNKFQRNAIHLESKAISVVGKSTKARNGDQENLKVDGGKEKKSRSTSRVLSVKPGPSRDAILRSPLIDGENVTLVQTNSQLSLEAKLVGREHENNGCENRKNEGTGVVPQKVMHFGSFCVQLI